MEPFLTIRLPCSMLTRAAEFSHWFLHQRSQQLLFLARRYLNSALFEMTHVTNCNYLKSIVACMDSLPYFLLHSIRSMSAIAKGSKLSCKKFLVLDRLDTNRNADIEGKCYSFFSFSCSSSCSSIIVMMMVMLMMMLLLTNNSHGTTV